MERGKLGGARETGWSEGDWVEQRGLGGVRGTGWSEGDWVE